MTPTHEHHGHHDDHPEPVCRGQAKDPVCGMKVDTAAPRGGTHVHDGTTYYFCSPKCREKLSAEPAKYLAPERERPPAPAGTTWTCPMHPEIVRDATGQLPDLRHGTRAAWRATGDEAENPELRDMTRRFWVGIALDGAAARPGRWPRCPGAAGAALLLGRALRSGCSSRSRRRSCCGAAGRSSSAAGRRSSTATSTCSR